MPSSRVKQNFGDLLSPSLPEQALEDRRTARAAQQLVEKNRLIKHQKLAIELLLMPETKRQDLIARARSEVLRWRRDRLCSADYADRWDELLGLSVGDMAKTMCSETLEWGPALRQNSPWHVIELTSP